MLTDEVYTTRDYFQILKQKWATNFDELENYYMKIKIRYNETGEYLKKYERYPNSYRYIYVVISLIVVSANGNSCSRI